MNCEHCGRKLIDTGRVVWLEKSFATNRWYQPGDCPEEESQGGFPFGWDCAKAVMTKQSAADQKHDAEYAAKNVL